MTTTVWARRAWSRKKNQFNQLLWVCYPGSLIIHFLVTRGAACPLTCSSFHFVLGSQAGMHSPHTGPKRGGHLLFAVVSREIWKIPYCLIRLCSGHKLTLMQLGRKGRSQKNIASRKNQLQRVLHQIDGTMFFAHVCFEDCSWGGLTCCQSPPAFHFWWLLSQMFIPKAEDRRFEIQYVLYIIVSYAAAWRLLSSINASFYLLQ